MDAREKLKEYKKIIDTEMGVFFDNFLESDLERTLLFDECITEIKEFNSRGKRIRPALAVVAYESVGGKDFKAMVDASLSIELAQGSFLIHDDIIDRDELRRGRKTVHSKYKDTCKERYPQADEHHFGTSMGLLVGDINLNLAYYSLLTSKFSTELKLQALSKLASIIINTCHGQTLDFINGFRKEISVDDSMYVNYLKTSKYTIEGPLHLGAILGNGNESQMKLFTKYAIPLGLGFQLKDDILGLYGNEVEVGKTIGSDLIEGKRTALILKTLELGDSAQNTIINKYLGKADLKNEELEIVRKVVRETGALSFMNKYISELIDEAKSTLVGADLKPESKEWLSDIAEFIGKRTY